jgi:hypothetical protein
MLLSAVAVSLPIFPILAGDLAGAGSTDPTLAIGQLVARPVGGGALVEVLGEFGFDDVVQVDYPLTLVVYRGTSFARYPAGAPAVVGTFAGLGDGLAVSEIATLESAGSTASAVEIVSLEPNRIVASLPAALSSAGSITAVLYVEVAGEGGFVSNAPTVALTSGGGS